MGVYERHLKTWNILHVLLGPFVRSKFNLECEEVKIDGPCIVIPNHASNWDPLLVAVAFRRKHVYFVASEHIYRWGFVSKLLEYFLAPIARRKASVASDTIRSMLRHIKDGHSVCIFGEGEATWNGISGKVLPATGKMVRSSGATLVTYKLEGAYLSDPRWGKKLRRGKVRGRVVNVYRPEQLRAMNPQQINDAINADIYEDVWERQRSEKLVFAGRDNAVGLDRGFFLCPKCRRIGTLKSRGNKIGCDCGFELEYLNTGFLSPAEPFETLAKWDEWQHEQLEKGEYVKGESELFSDGDISLFSDSRDKSELICRGTLRQTEDSLIIGEHEIKLDDISHMDMVNTHKLFIKTEEDYYELRANSDCCLRKYLAVWKNHAKLKTALAV